MDGHVRNPEKAEWQFLPTVSPRHFHFSCQSPFSSHFARLPATLHAILALSTATTITSSSNDGQLLSRMGEGAVHILDIVRAVRIVTDDDTPVGMKSTVGMSPIARHRRTVWDERWLVGLSGIRIGVEVVLSVVLLLELLVVRLALNCRPVVADSPEYKRNKRERRKKSNLTIRIREANSL